MGRGGWWGFEGFFVVVFFLRIVVFRLKNNFLFVKDNAAYWIVLGS